MARAFSGTLQCFSLPNLTKLDVTTQLSISAWAYVTSAPASGNQQTIITNGTAASQRNFAFDYRNIGGTLQLELSNTVGASFGEMRAVTTLSLNTWHLVVFSVDWTLNPWVGTCYVDGSSVTVTNSGSVTTGTPSTSSTDRGIGTALPATQSALWKGNLADIAVWKGVLLSALEAKGLALGARAFQIRGTSLVGYWPLDGLQLPEPDLSGSVMNASAGAGTPTSAFGPPFMMFTPRWLQQPPAPPIGILMPQACL